MSAAVPIGTFLLVAFFIMEVIGLVTEYWMVVAHSSGLVQSHAGLFKICYEILSQEACFYYIQYAEDFLNVHYFGIAGSSLLGCLLLFIACLIGFCGCSKPNPKPTVQNIAGVGLFGGFFCGAGALWYYLYFFKGTFGDMATILSVFGVDVGPGWSFYLCVAAGGGALIVSFILMIIGCSMPVHQGAVVSNQQPQTVIAMTGGPMPVVQHQQYPPTVVAMQNSAYNDPFGPQQLYGHQSQQSYGHQPQPSYGNQHGYHPQPEKS